MFHSRVFKTWIHLLCTLREIFIKILPNNILNSLQQIHKRNFLKTLTCFPFEIIFASEREYLEELRMELGGGKVENDDHDRLKHH